jgi:hypothetical protein
MKNYKKEKKEDPKIKSKPVKGEFPLMKKKTKGKPKYK